MPRIGNAPSGENSSLAGTEKVPVTGSQYTLVSTIRAYVKTLTDTLYSAFEHSHADSDTGGAVNHTALTGAGTSLHVPTYSSDSNTYLNGKGEWTTVTASPGDVYDSDILFQDITTGNADSDQHGFLPKLSGDSDQYLNGDGEWAAVSGSGAPTSAEYVTTASDGTLSAEVVIPGLAGSADISGSAGAGVSYEFDSGASPLTWSAAVDTEDVDTTVKSHLYIQDNGASETLGTYTWEPAGAFDIRCKISFGSEVGTSASSPAAGLIVGDSAMNNRVMMHLAYDGANDRFFIQAYTYAASTYTQRGANQNSVPNSVYFRIVRDGSNNNSFYWSSDGITWLLIATQALTYTAAKAGIRVAAASLVSNVAVDWIRSNV